MRLVDILYYVAVDIPRLWHQLKVRPERQEVLRKCLCLTQRHFYLFPGFNSCILSCKASRWSLHKPFCKLRKRTNPAVSDDNIRCVCCSIMTCWYHPPFKSMVNAIGGELVSLDGRFDGRFGHVVTSSSAGISLLLERPIGHPAEADVLGERFHEHGGVAFLR